MPVVVKQLENVADSGPALILMLFIYLIFYPLEVVSRYRDPQLQVAENYIFV